MDSLILSLQSLGAWQKSLQQNQTKEKNDGLIKETCDKAIARVCLVSGSLFFICALSAVIKHIFGFFVPLMI